MEDLKLDLEEGIFLQTTNVERYLKNDDYIEVYEMYLTNKNLICVYEKFNGMFKKAETIVDKIPLTDIKVVNDKVQVMEVDNDDYGLGLQILFTNGSREHFVFENKKEIQSWLNEISEVVIKNTQNTPKKEKEKVKESRNEDIEESGDSKDKKYMYCSSCGEKIDSNSKYCNSCGKLAKGNDDKNSEDSENKVEEDNSKRKSSYEGDIHKCPNCGEIIKGFESKCSSCGLELRNSSSSINIKEFSNKVNNAKSIDECAKLIRNFPIPNNKEDILEFMILSSSNLIGQEDKKLFEAWLAKFQQCYQKSEILFKDDKVFSKIEKIYQDTNLKIKNKKGVYMVIDFRKWFMTNPIFSFVFICVLIFALFRIFRGEFAGLDIIVDAMILVIVYKKTTNKNKNGDK